MSKTKWFLLGFDVEATRASVLQDNATVYFHKRGSSDRAWFTPAEARQFAEVLLNAAKTAEEK